MANKKDYCIGWAGFCNGQITGTLEKYGESPAILAIYIRKKDATKHYQDVRKVKITEIN